MGQIGGREFETPAVQACTLALWTGLFVLNASKLVSKAAESKRPEKITFGTSCTITVCA